jgi:hypothetical protein
MADRVARQVLDSTADISSETTLSHGLTCSMR